MIRKALLYHLLQGTFILPTDCKENLFKGSYNCIGLKDTDPQQQKKTPKGIYTPGSVLKEKRKKKKWSRWWTPGKTWDFLTNPWFLSSIIIYQRLLGLKSCISMAVPLQGELHKPDWGQEIPFPPSPLRLFKLHAIVMNKITLTRIHSFHHSFQQFCYRICAWLLVFPAWKAVSEHGVCCLHRSRRL